MVGDVLLQQFRVSPVLCRSTEPSGPGCPQFLSFSSLPPCPAVLELLHHALLPPLMMPQALLRSTFNSFISLRSGLHPFPQRCSYLDPHPALLPSLPQVSETPNHLVINNTAFNNTAFGPCPSKNPTPSAALKIPCKRFSIIT